MQQSEISKELKGFITIKCPNCKDGKLQHIREGQGLSCPVCEYITLIDNFTNKYSKGSKS